MPTLLASLTTLLVLAATPPGAQVPALVIPPTNPPAVVSQRVGATDVEVRYNRPGVKGRTIFGELVPFGQVWRTGSDSATRISFSTPVTVNGAAIPAGTYEQFTIPGASRWTVIIHQNRSQWGSYSYDPANDVARIITAPVKTPDLVETFTITIDDLARSAATMNIAWEHTRVPLRLEVDVVGQMVPKIMAAMASEGRRPYFLAAMFYFENDLDLDQAAAWMAAAIAEQPGHIGMLYRQALILAKKGDTPGAIAAATRSLDGAAKANRELREEYTKLNTVLLAKLRGGGR
jgi:hypothetical protein